jgi:AraC-like DNA-binding protein
MVMNEIAQKRDAASREEMIARIRGSFQADGAVEPIPGFHLSRASHPTERLHGVSKLSLCVIAQGSKEVCLGDATYRYDADNYLLSTVELPVTGRIVVATEARPYLSLWIDLDPTLVGSVMAEADLGAPPASDAKAMGVSHVDAGLRDSIIRVLRLFDSPTETRMLMPLIMREIIFRLLTGEQGNRLRHLSTSGGNSHQIANAVEKIRLNFDQPLRIESLAKEFGMSPSTFHHHFKSITDMSPLQFQKQMRLQSARQLMLSERLDAMSAGRRVGYEDASYFSRDYKRYFGESPIRDAERLRSLAGAGAE